MICAMYECCHCGLGIAATTTDPVIWTSKGKFHHGCMLTFYRQLAETEEERRERKHREASIRGHQRDMAPMSLVTFK